MWAFVDESGDPNLNFEKDGVSTWYILCSIMVSDEKVAELRDQVEALRKKHFQTGEMKSSGLSSNQKRWSALLRDLAPIDFGFCALLIDKREIDRSSGLQFKKSFIKNIHKRLYEKIFLAHPNLSVRADKQGREPFQNGFKEYLEKTHGPTLFDRRNFDFVDSKAEVLVQLADIVCGCLARTYADDKRAGNKLFQALLQKSQLLEFWPPRPQKTLTHSSTNANWTTADHRIDDYAVRTAENFINKNDSAVGDIECQVAIVNRLLLQREFGDSNTVTTEELIDNLRSRGLAPKSVPWFRSKIIAGLRDAGVLITSSSHGYALPSCEGDIMSFVEHAQTMCGPLLRRIKAACEAVALATNGEVNVLQRPQFEQIAALVDTLNSAAARFPANESSSMERELRNQADRT